MFLKILTVAVLTAVLVLAAAAFTPLPRKLRVQKNKPLVIERALYPAVQRGNTLIAYLADAAGNAVVALAVVDSVTTDSFYLHILPPFGARERNQHAERHSSHD